VAQVPTARATLSLRAAAILCGIFLLVGASQVTAKLQQEGSAPAAQPLYTLAVFGTAFVGAFLMRMRQREPFGRREIVLGIILGSLNLGGTLFLLRALTELPAIIVFPANSCSSLLLVVLTARWFWREHPSLGAQAGIWLALAAVGLLAA
jgi:drug/metabolite transporter (DMT)-like permease